MKFSNAKTEKDIIEALKGFKLKKSNKGCQQYVYHYTNASAVIAILKSKFFYIGSPERMNDGLELSNLQSIDTKNIFFTCFVSEDRENIGMWSMYAQPWNEGVIIRIPVEKYKQWIENSQIYSANPNTKKPISRIYDGTISSYFVAYSNVDSKNKSEKELYCCGNQVNNVFRMNAKRKDVLAGYIKDLAWSYEKELRLRVDTIEKYEAVSISIPDDILDSFEIITGPRYEQNLLSKIRNEIDKKFSESRIIPSTFTGRLNHVYCDNCKKK